jgi:outer membrane protein assembly factor BamB
LIETKTGSVNVLAAFDSGVRALEGSTGKELWRAGLAGDAMAGVAMTAEKDNVPSLAVLDDSRTLSFLKGDTGQLLSETKLEGFVVGRPVAVRLKNEGAVLLALNNGTLDVRNTAGVSLFAVRLDAALTTSPIVVRGGGKQLVLIGTESGLVALDAADLTPLWRVATETDVPQGMLAAADIDGDGADDLVMLTRRGRTVAVNLANGKIKWYVDGATDALRVAFADVDGDGGLDVLVAAGPAFAHGFSGKDGTLIWKAEDASRTDAAGAGGKVTRGLLAGAFGKGAVPLVLGTDPGRTGLRAVGLPAKTPK